MLRCVQMKHVATARAERNLRLIVAVIFALTTVVAVFLRAAWQFEVALIAVVFSFLGKKSLLENMAKIVSVVVKRK